MVAALTGLSVQPPPQSKIETPHGLLELGITTLPLLYGGGSFSAGGVVGADVVVVEAALGWVEVGVELGIVVSGGDVWLVVFEPGEHCAIPKIKVTSTPRTPATLPTTVQNSARVWPKMRRRFRLRTAATVTRAWLAPKDCLGRQLITSRYV
ncbi:hypothetical protein ACIA8C_18345 [Nocardia sp. NPDC051321]|uniref:hypothetical protein n=1 Tax=Nocardia sp. NPDC051321 TaxID=3364323 RepID=UPI00379BA8F2